MIRKYIFAFCILALSAGAWSATGESGIFGICNICGDTQEKPPAAAAVSPYDNSDPWNLLRGQLHIHSKPDKNWLGDEETPEEVAWHYWFAGFYFMALTNHNDVSGAALGYDAPPIQWGPHSDELTHGGLVLNRNKDGHILAIGTNAMQNSELDSDTTGNRVYDLMTRIDKVHSQQGLAFIAHPDSSPYLVSPRDICAIYNACRPLREGGNAIGLPVDGIGIYHGPGKKDSCGTWNQVLRAGYRVWGYAEDDYHPQRSSDFDDVIAANGMKNGNTWVAVPGNGTEDWAYIKDRLIKGDYYVYWLEGYKEWTSSDGIPPRMKVTTDNSGTYPTIRVELKKGNDDPWVADIAFTDEDGTIDAGTGSLASFTTTATKDYVRITAIGTLFDGRRLHIASQPVWISPWGERLTSARGLLATSPELHLRFLPFDERPAAFPPAGYIDYVFDVTTDSGTCPPGATLDPSFDGEDTSAIGGTQFLAMYRYDAGTSAWAKVGGTVDPGTATISSPITALGYYTISADLPADTTAPEVFIDNPPRGGIVNADAEIKATVNDDLGAWRVNFSINDNPLGEDADALDGWSVNLPYADYCEGDYTLKAVAEDLAGNQGTAEIPIHIHSTTPQPTISITSPTVGSSLSGTVTATGTCWDDVLVNTVALYTDDTLIVYGELDESGGWLANVDTTYLANGPRTITAVVKDYPGNEASASVDVTINNSTVSIGDARQGDDEQVVSLDEATVTAGTAEIGGAFYIEADNKSAGIRIATNRTIREGDRVYIAGPPYLENGERQISATDIRVSSSDNDLPHILSMPLRSLGGSDSGIPGAIGLYNIGLLIRTVGTVTQVGDDYLYIDDGSSLKDGTLTGADQNIGVRVICDPADYHAGDHLIVTGISSCFETPSAQIARRILVRRSEDVHKITP